MSFWTTSDNAPIQATGVAEMGGGDLPPIPSGTVLTAMVTEAKWDSNESTGERLIKVRWDVLEGEFKKRVVFQKVRVLDADAKKKDKALRMLAAIDVNAGGRLMSLGKEPTDMDLASCLTNKPQKIKVAIWAMDNETTGEKMSGNWVQSVAGMNSAVAAAPAASGIGF